MNYYGTGKYIEEMKRLDEQVFSKIRFDEPEREKELESGYLVRYYYYADEENREPGHAPVDGEICRLFKDDRMVFEWKNTDGNSRMACIIHHADGNTYFVFDEDLYGYSVLNLDSLQCMHYIPSESYGKYPEEFEETYGHISIDVPETTKEEILKLSLDFFSHWDSIDNLKKHVIDFVEWEKRNPIEKRRTGKVESDPAYPCLFTLSDKAKAAILDL